MNRFVLLVIGLVAVMIVPAWAQSPAEVVLSSTWGPNPGQFAHGDDGDESGPSCFTVDALGNVYVTDDMNSRIQQFDPTGKLVNTYTNSGPDEFLAISVDLSPDRHVKSRTIYTANGSQIGGKAIIIGKAEKGVIRQVMLPAASPEVIDRIATDSRHRLFVEGENIFEGTNIAENSTPSVWLFDGDLQYRGQRQLSDICIQHGSEDLVGVSQKCAVDGQPALQRWTIQFMSPVDMQYTVVKTVEIDVPKPDFHQETYLVGVDIPGNLYVYGMTVGKRPAEFHYQITRYSPNGALTGTLDLDPFLGENQYVLYPYRNIYIDQHGGVYVAAGTKKAYQIRRFSWPQAAK